MFERLDITIYEAIRLALVAGGWLPDITLYGVGDEADYLDAINVLKAANHYVALENIARNIAKGAKELNAIYVFHRRRKQSAAAMAQTTYVNSDDHEMRVTDTKWDITYELRYIAVDYAMSVKLQQLIADVFPIHRWFNILDLDGASTDEKVLITYETDMEIQGTDRLEWAYQYVANDIMLSPATDNGAIALIEEIHVLNEDGNEIMVVQ